MTITFKLWFHHTQQNKWGLKKKKESNILDLEYLDRDKKGENSQSQSWVISPGNGMNVVIFLFKTNSCLKTPLKKKKKKSRHRNHREREREREKEDDPKNKPQMNFL